MNRLNAAFRISETSLAIGIFWISYIIPNSASCIYCQENHTLRTNLYKIIASIALYCTSDVADLWHVLASCLIKGLLLGKSFLLSIGLPPLHWFPCKIYCPRCRPAVTSILHFIQTHNRSRTKINLWRRLWADYMYGLLNDQKSKQNSLKWSSSFSSIYSSVWRTVGWSWIPALLIASRFH